MWDSDEAFSQEMLDTGVWELSGVDQNGEMTIQVNWDLMEELYPEVYAVVYPEWLKEIQESLDNLITMGMIEEHETEEGPTYSLTEHGRFVAGLDNPTIDDVT